MALSDNLRQILGRQKELLQELEHEVLKISENDLAKENDSIKAELDKLKSDYSEVKERLAQLSAENASLKNTLYEQIYNEKLSILKMSSERLHAYFSESQQSGIDRLTRFESNVKNKISTMEKELQDNFVDSKDEIYSKLDELAILLDNKVTAAKEELAKHSGPFSENEKAEFQKLKDEQITDDTIKQIARKNNIESFVGLNLINKLGIFLIVIGVIAASQYSYFKLPPTLKGIMMFCLGGLLLIAGELLNRRKPNIFSLGVTSGGVAVLYVALSISYFGLKILHMYPALILCVLITAGAFVLSQRYNSRTIAAFALIGGYLPLFSVNMENIALIYGAMVYFVALNILALMISVNKKWVVNQYIGFFLNVIGTVMIQGNTINRINNTDPRNIILLIYIVFAFVIYTLIPVLSTYYKKSRFAKSDTILLGLNTFISAIIMYSTFDNLNLEDFNGLLAVIFAVVYLLLGRFIETKFQSENNTKALFYLTGLAFVVLIIPFQFGKEWLSLGWLAEGVAITSYGILRNEKNFRKYGFIINALCAASFLFFDLLLSIDNLFAYKYVAITLGSIIILASYIYAKTISNKYASAFKYGTIINTWICLSYLINEKLYMFIIKTVSGGVIYNTFNIIYLIHALSIVVTFLFAYGVARYKKLSDMGTKIISMGIYTIGILQLLTLNASDKPIIMPYGKASVLGVMLGTAILILVGLMSVYAVRDIIMFLVMDKKVGAEFYPLAISIYFVFILTQNLIAQYGLSITNGAISIIYVLTALVWIIFGFVKRYAFIRRFGLGLAILSVIKLFILDLSFLTDIYRIISYFALGITLVAISFVYQYFNKRLELAVEGICDEQKTI